MPASSSKINVPERRITFHVDMDSFFASVEVRERPELKGLPVVVGSDPKGGSGRGVVSTCSYEARKYGIHSAMPISQAYRLCPDAVFLPVNMKLYAGVSAKVMELLKGFADRLQQVSVDEAYLVPGPEIRNFEEAAMYALRIKDEVQKQEGITCSVGIGPNKLIAKIASGFQKPDGLTVVRSGDVREFLFPLPVSKIPGIGKKTAETLKIMGITRVEELASCDVQFLLEKFGKMGLRMKQLANGLDFEEVRENKSIKSISRHGTFAEDTNDPVKITGSLDLLIESVHRSLLKHRFLFRTVTLTVRFEDFSTYTRSKTIPIWTSDLFVMKRIAMQLLSEFIGNRKLRLVGIGVAKLRERDEKQTLITDF
ncbi:MAG: DNA polymerase IV [Methanosarcina flavescens]|jgi:DNA polymerase IV (DinB-like DNA polymerase)|uniref:DNA polymerase IV n=1 Tax=Methanosarcina flavescens TaxID=1715806 RepID=A0A660HUI1_9EURY|nr:DNA polymerase IV [Methanosarcina flavescens]AYK16010.1 DNA polymerase IV [Methanosarcina flavescens]NLK33332.1 DNA polymerase IV [Methanosarcina flavescens]